MLFNNKSITKSLLVYVIMCLAISISGCRKFVQVDAPITSTSAENIYKTDAGAISVLTGIYAQLSTTSNYGNPGFMGLSLFGSLSADELTLYSSSTNAKYISYYRNALAANTYGFEYWQSIYPYIFTCNSAVEGLAKSTSLTPAISTQLMGEAKFMRAFFYFYLVNLYGDIPLLTSSDYKSNVTLPRSPKTILYRQIITDLQDAQNNLSSNYLNSTLLQTTTEKVRPTQWAARALLARAYLYNQNWDSAESQSTAIISSSKYSLDTLNGVFLKNSKESIWQLQPVNSLWNTEDAKLFIIPANGPNTSNPVYLSDGLYGSFEAGDQRKNKWVQSLAIGPSTYYYPFKYKVNTQGASVTEYFMMFRLGEQLLIRAEARVQKGDANAVNDLNAIRLRAGLPVYSGPTDKASLLNAIQRERRVELFTELGQRWFDLKRTGNIDSVMNIATVQKGGTWRSYQQLYPIPVSDIQADLNLAQNIGY